MCLKIQSYTDVITNSSSSIFTIKGYEEEVIREMIDKLFEVVTLKNGKDDPYYGYSIWSESNGNVIVDSVGDNSIPYLVQRFLEYDLGANRCHNG